MLYEVITANPNCSTIQMVVALKPLHDIAKIKRVVVSTYQSVSGSGKAAMDELFNQTKALFSNGEVRNEVYAKQIAVNVIPRITSYNVCYTKLLRAQVRAILSQVKKHPEAKGIEILVPNSRSMNDLQFAYDVVRDVADEEELKVSRDSYNFV